jgi:hypothetical protein
MEEKITTTRRKRSALEASLQEWYAENEDRTKQLERVVKGEAEFSLREIDWFVTNYSARNPVVYTLPSGKVVDVNGDYKDVLKSFHKVGFDAFKRKGTDPSEAPLRQMNFFRWAIENGVVDYVAQHAKTIESDMAQMRKRKKTSAPNPSPKRQAQGMGVAFRSIDTMLSIPSFVRPEW